MVDVRRRSGGGGAAVVMAVLGWIAALGLLALTLILYHRFAALKEAVHSNQSAFESEIGNYFETIDRRLAPATDPFDIKYKDEAFKEVRKELDKAKLYDGLKSVLGWESEANLEKSIETKVSELEKSEQIPFTTLRSAVDHYDSLVKRYRSQIADLKKSYDGALDNLTQIRAADARIAKTRREELERLRSDYTSRFRKFSDEVNAVTKKWNDMRGERDKLAKELDDTRLDLKRQLALKGTEIAKLEDKIAEILREKEGIPALTPVGEVKLVKQGLNMVFVTGGADKGRRRNERFMVYSQSPLGERILKGQLILKAIYEHTSLGSMISTVKDSPVIEGDLYVDALLWNRHEQLEAGKITVTEYKEGGKKPAAPSVTLSPEAQKKKAELIQVAKSLNITLSAEQDKQLDKLVIEGLQMEKAGKSDQEIANALKPKLLNISPEFAKLFEGPKSE